VRQLDKRAKIFVAGHAGLVGSAVVRALRARGCENLLLVPRAELDLTSQAAVADLFRREKPEIVLHCAGKVGGIQANNTLRADFIRENLLMATNIIDSAYRCGARKTLVLGSSCVYPRLAQQPLREEFLLTGLLEPTNEPYAIAKIAGLAMAQAYHVQYGMAVVRAVGANTYGPGDNFDPDSSHVIPALLRRFDEARVNGAPEVTIWGTGRPIREFIYVEDFADALLYLLDRYESADLINVGTGEEISVAELAATAASVVHYAGKIRFDATKPDGMPKKVLDCSRLRQAGWHPKYTLRRGLELTYDWFLANAERRDR
jgi:GDP-L-fucose synthase